MESLISTSGQQRLPTETEAFPEAQGDICQAAVSLSSSMACELILAACLF